MKLLRFGKSGEEKPAVLDCDGNIRDLSSHITDIDSDSLASKSLAKIAKIDSQSLPLVAAERIGPPVADIGKLVCIGLNYHLHAQEAGIEAPEEPIIFMKATTSICGPNDNIIIPKYSTKTDWEVELAVVIGRIAQYVDKNNAMEYVAGYCVANDVSERAFQIERSGQWVKGKSADTFCPLGPYFVSKDEVSNPQQLRLWLEVNGHRYQDGSTDDMIFGVAHIVSYVSNFMTLMPGDLILTGTPSGVGLGLKPQVFLRPGDEIKLSVEGLGVQKQSVVAYSG